MPRASAFVPLLCAACATSTGESAESTTSAADTTATAASSSTITGQADSSSGDTTSGGTGTHATTGTTGDTEGEACRFPTFTRAREWLRTTDEGNCNATLAEKFGGDCENFHWLGLIGDPWVLQRDGEFHMWFTAGHRIGENVWQSSIAHARSDDGILWDDPKDLDEDVLPVLEPGLAGVDATGTETISVLVGDDGMWRMFYSGALSEAPDVSYVIALATSRDGVAWTKHPEPVLTPTLGWEQPFDAGGFEVGGVLEPTVLLEDGRYRMWYTAFGHEGDEPAYARIGHAESDDGLVWTKSETPVFRGANVEFDVLGVSHTNVVKDPIDGYHLFYVGIAANEDLRLGHAWSPDGLDWQPNPANPILSGVPGEWDARLVGGPSALIIDGTLRLYYMGTTVPDFSAPVRFAMTEAVCG